MSPRTYWKHYIDAAGGIPAVVDRLGIPYSTIAAVTNGWRGIGHKLAQRMVEADPSLDASVLVWVRPLRDAAEKQKAA
jgi:hypothetical protein